jgi:hypothetical protein
VYSSPQWLRYVDKVAVDMTNFYFVGSDDAVQPMMDQHLLEKTHDPCVDIFLKIHIAWDGTLDICSQDAHHYPEYALGKLGAMSIRQAWTCKRFEHHRDREGRALHHDCYRLCKNCYTATHKYDHLKGELVSEGKHV